MVDFLSCEPQHESFGDIPFFADLHEGVGVDNVTARNGLRCEDKPFQASLSLVDPAAMTAALRLPLSATPDINAAICAIAANLVCLEQIGHERWLFYSRDNNHFAQMRRYVPSFYRRPTMIAAVDQLERAGLIVHQQTRPSPRAAYRSRLRPTEELRVRIRGLTAVATSLNPSEVIVLRDADKRPISYRETAATKAMRQDVFAHNEYLRGLAITVRHPEARIDALGYLVINDCRLNLTRNTYYRVFKIRFTQCGRWYGPWWQNVPSHIRQGIQINGEPTCEPDIRGCHMRLLCARAVLELRETDPYEGLGLPRKEVKLAINVMLNASSWPSARGALIERLASQYGAAVGIQADLLRTRVRDRFPALDPFWNTGYGLVLQNIDAAICARLQRKLRDRGVPALSIHDSFIVPQSARGLTVGVMEEEFDKACYQFRRGGRQIFNLKRRVRLP